MSSALMRLCRVCCLVILALACLLQLGRTPINETDEGFAANRAASFALHGSSVLTYDDLNGSEPQFRKPPMLYWCVAGCYRLFGQSEFTARLPTALFSIGLCAVLVLFFRRFVQEGLAWGGVLLFAAVPFALFHMRTAMLEMPFLFFSMSAIHLLSHRPGARPALAAGLLCGAAALTKGAAGLSSLAFALVISAVLRRGRDGWWRDGLIAIAAAAAVVAAYFAAIPSEWQEKAVNAYFLSEGANRTAGQKFLVRFALGFRPLWENLGPVLIAAGAGLAAAIGGRRHGRALVIAALLVVPTFLTASQQVVPFPRYFFVIYPVASTLAVAAGYALAGGGAALWIALPLAAAFALLCGPAGWLLAGLALVLWAGGHAPAVRRNNAYRPAGTAAFTLALGLSLWQSHPALVCVHHEVRLNRPEVIPLARLAAREVPPSQSLLFCTGVKVKVHQLLFYSGRRLEDLTEWAHYGMQPGVERLVLQFAGNRLPVPFVEETTVAVSGPWRLVRMRVTKEAEAYASVSIGSDKQRPAAALTYALLGLATETNGAVLLARRADDGPLKADISRPYGERLGPDAKVAVEWDGAKPVAGIDVVATAANLAFKGLRVEWRDAEGTWREWARLGGEPLLQLDREGGRLVRRSERALRIRGDARSATGIRLLTCPGMRRLLLNRVNVYVTAAPASGNLIDHTHE